LEKGKTKGKLMRKKVRTGKGGNRERKEGKWQRVLLRIRIGPDPDAVLHHL
jgi:hypothetical protein